MNSDDLVSFSPVVPTQSILKQVCDDHNLMVLQTPTHKNLKVSFQTPARTPLGTIVQQKRENLPASGVLNKRSIQPLLEYVDEDVLWKERIEVVTKWDHQEYTKCAKDFLEEIVDEVVTSRSLMADSNMSNQPKNIKDDNSWLDNLTAPASKNLDFLNCLNDSSEPEDDKENQEPAFDRTPLQPQSLESRVIIQPTTVQNQHVTTSPSANEASVLRTSTEAEAGNNFQLVANPFVPRNCLRISPRQKSDSSSSCAKTPGATYPHETAPSLSLPGSSCGDDSVTCLNLSAENPFESSKGSGTSTQPDVTSTQPDVLFSVFGTQKPNDVATNSQNIGEDRNLLEDGFTDATTLLDRGFDFDLDFLESKGHDNVSSDLRKQSLYLKFDPFLSRDDPDVHPCTGRKSDIIDLTSRLSLHRQTLQTPVKPVESKCSKPEMPDFLCDSPRTFLKPQLASEPKVTVESDGRDLQSQAEDGCDEIIEVLKYSEKAMKRLLEEAEAPLQIKIGKLEAELETSKAENGQLVALMNDFAVTMTTMEEEQKLEAIKNTEEIAKINKENKDLKDQLNVVEKAFAELLARSEKTKIAINNFKVNENTYKSAIEQYEAGKREMTQKYNALKVSAEEDRKKLVEESQKKQNELRAQLAGAKARCKVVESQCKSLESRLTQTTNENKELTKICDELIEQQQQRTTKN